VTIGQDVKTRLSEIDRQLEPFITAEGRGKKSGELADALHRLVWCVRDLTDEVERLRGPSL